MRGGEIEPAAYLAFAFEAAQASRYAEVKIGGKKSLFTRFVWHGAKIDPDLGGCRDFGIDSRITKD